MGESKVKPVRKIIAYKFKLQSIKKRSLKGIDKTV